LTGAYIVNSFKERECCNVKAKRQISPIVWMVGLAVLFLFLLSVRKELGAGEHSLDNVVKQGLAGEFCNSIYHNFVPAFSFVQENGSETVWLLDRQMTEVMPIYGYAMEQYQKEAQEDALLVLDEILLAEAEEGTSWEQETKTETPQSMEELLKAENEAAMQAAEALEQQQSVFVPHTLQAQVDVAQLQTYETLVQNFYTIDGNTMAGSDQLNVDKLTSYDATISKESEGPQILIYHTHSQETFADSLPGDESTSIVGVGEHLAQILTQTYGYEVLHHTGQYDVDVRDDAYSASLPAIERVLAEHPSIQVIIDLHRDQMPEETKLVMDLDGRPTARFMFFNGLSRTKKTGNISYLYNENQEENLAFSFQMQMKAAEYYPGLTRKIYLKGYRYNMHLRPRTLLVELGAQNNTVEEAMNACDPLAHILDMVLTGQ